MKRAKRVIIKLEPEDPEDLVEMLQALDQALNPTQYEVGIKQTVRPKDPSQEQPTSSRDARVEEDARDAIRRALASPEQKSIGVPPAADPSQAAELKLRVGLCERAVRVVKFVSVECVRASIKVVVEAMIKGPAGPGA